jgi:amidase
MWGEYSNYDGLALAELVRNREVTALELIEAACDAIARLNPTLNAVCHDLADRGRAACRQSIPPGPFTGVPFLLKDIGAQMKGTAYECGSCLMRGNVSKYDSTLTERFTRAGLITIGKTTTPEFGAQITTESLLTGITRNPWNRAITPGGSSGGAAAAVAAGIVPLAHANDGLGSIRIPAANCGLFGLKPTRQRTPAGPVNADVSGGRGVEFVVTRSVRDSAALLDCVHGMDAGAPHCAPPPRRPYMEELQLDDKPLRIAVMDHTFSGGAVHPECAAAVKVIAECCEDLGHRVEASAPQVDWEAYLRAIRSAGSASFAAGLDAVGTALNRTPDETNLEPLTWLSWLEGKSLSATEYFRALDVFAALQRGLGRFFATYDILITPMLSQPPAKLGWLGTPHNNLDVFWDKFAGDAYSPFAGLFNVTGQPAASVPTLLGDGHCPIGTQLVAPFGEEGLIFRLAAQLERARPWRHSLPTIHFSTPSRTADRRGSAGEGLT